MAPNNAVEFLTKFAPLFESPVVRNWVWLPEDDDFNKTASWPLSEAGDFLSTVVTVDLGLTMLTLTITERPVDDAGGVDGQISFSASILFDERSISLNDEFLSFDEESIASVIAQFNAATSA